MVDLHSKCHSMEDVGRVFNKMPSCDVVIWNAILLGCKMQPGEKALELS
jgi:hypothetical protein